jgi:hypothetical protein
VDLQKEEEPNEKNIQNTKQTRKTKNLTNVPVDIIHHIKEDGGAVSGVHNNAIDGNVPIFVHGMVLVNVPKPSRQSMIALPHKEHLANKVREVRVILEY